MVRQASTGVFVNVTLQCASATLTTQPASHPHGAVHMRDLVALVLRVEMIPQGVRIFAHLVAQIHETDKIHLILPRACVALLRRNLLVRRATRLSRVLCFGHWDCKQSKPRAFAR